MNENTDEMVTLTAELESIPMPTLSVVVDVNELLDRMDQDDLFEFLGKLKDLLT